MRLPQEMIVLYDGECVLCNFWISKIKNNPNASCFQTISLEQWKKNNEQNASIYGLELPDSVVLIYNNQIFTESDAVLKIVSNLAGPMRLLLIGYLIPRFIRNLIYRWVAKNRYRWFGSKNAC